MKFSAALVPAEAVEAGPPDRVVEEAAEAEEAAC
jgi:hypothetical protein